VADATEHPFAVGLLPGQDDVLKKTEARAAAGEERLVDWQTAKHELRKRFE